MSNWWKRGWMKPVAALMLVTMGMVSLVPRVDGAFISSESIYSDQRIQDLGQIRKILEEKQIGERLKALGYSREEIEARLSQLSDTEIHDLAVQVDTLVTGGVLGAVIGVLVVILLVVVILKIVDKRIIVK